MMKKQTRVIFFAIFALLAFGLLAYPATQNATAAAGTTGNISAGVSGVFLNTVVAIKAFNMEVSADYSLEVNDVATHNWTNSATQTSKTFFMTFESSQVSGGMIKVELVNQSITVLDTVFLTVTSVEDIVDTDFAFDLFAPLLILGIIILVVGTVLGGQALLKKREG